LATEAPRLAKLAEVRADEIAAALNDFEVARWLSRAPHPYSVEDARAFLAANAGPAKRVRAILDGKGFAGIVGMERELGFWIVRRAWGRGYATWAAAAMLAGHFFDGDDAVISGHHHGNAASAAVQARLGFRATHDETVTPVSTGRPTVLHRTRLDRGGWLAAQGLPIDLGGATLRPFRACDAAPFRRIVIRPEVGRMLLRFPAGWTDAEADAFLRRVLYTRRLGFHLAIADADDRLVGSVGVGSGEEPEIFYFLGPAAAGGGLMSRAVDAFVAFVLARFPVTGLRAEVFTDNPASARVLEKIGFVRGGEGLAHSAQRLEPAPVWKYRLSRQAFLA
jgi:RimJ/RimL family protein N-acetyltransferase